MSEQERTGQVRAAEPADLALPVSSAAAPVTVKPIQPEQAGWSPMMFGAVFVGVFAVALLAMLGMTRYAQHREIQPTAPRVASHLPPTELVAPPTRPDPKYYSDDDAWESLTKGQKTLPKQGAPDRIGPLLVALRDTNPDARRHVLWDLTLMTPPNDVRRANVVQALVELAKAPNRGDAEDIQNALKMWAKREDIPLLLPLLKDAKEEVRSIGIMVFGEIKDRKAAEVVAPMLETNNDRKRAGTALKQIGREGELVVRNYLSSASPAVRQEACAVLGEIGTRASLTQLRGLAADPEPDVRFAADQAIAAILARGA